MRTTARAGRRLAPALFSSLAALCALSFCRPGGVLQSPSAADLEGFPSPESAAAKVGTAPDPMAWSVPDVTPQPVRVIFKSPVVSSQGKTTIQVSFNQPMVPLGPVKSRAEAPELYPIRIDPPVSAEYRWVGGDILKVALTKPLDNATEYRVKLLPELRSLAGTSLEEQVEWAFETPRPRVLWVRTEAAQPVAARHIHPSDGFRVAVNLLARSEDLAKVLTLKAGGEVWPVRVTASPKRPHEHLVQPTRPLPLGADIALTVARGLVSTEGPLPSTEVRVHKARVYGPLGVEVRCGSGTPEDGEPCWPMSHEQDGGLAIEFTEPVTRAELLARLRVNPPVPDLAKRLWPHMHQCSFSPAKGRLVGSCASWWLVHGDLRPATAYSVRVEGALTDVWGQRLGKAHLTSFRTRDFPPGLHLPTGGESIREPWHPWQLKATNARTVDVRIHAFTGPDLARFVTCMRRERNWEEGCLGEEPTQERRLRLGGARNVTQTATLALPPGLVSLQLTSPQVVDSEGKPVRFTRLALQTDLGLHVRLSPFGLTAWVTSLSKGQGQGGVEVTVYDRKGQALGRGKTDAAGLLRLSRADLPGILEAKDPPAVVIVARRGQDLAYATPVKWKKGHRRYSSWDRDGSHWDDDGFGHWYRSGYGSSASWQGDRPLLVGYVSTERGIYRPGHEVFVHGAVREFRAWQGRGAAGQVVTLALENQMGLELARGEARTSEHGVFLTRLTLPAEGRLGYHRVRLSVGGKVLGTHSFRVEEYQAPEFTAKVWLTPSWPKKVLADAELRVDLTGLYLFGGAMSGAGYSLRVTRSAAAMTWERWKGFAAGANGYVIGEEPDTWHRSEGVLDGKGKRRLGLPLREQAKAPVPWPGYQSAEVEIRSATRRTVADRHQTLQVPGERLVAMRAQSSDLGTLRHRLLVVDPEGVPHGAKEVEARLLATKRKRWRVVVDWDRVLHKQTLAVGVKGAELAVPWPKGYDESQAYLMLVVLDSKGREARTGALVSRPTREVLRGERQDRLEKEKKAELTLSLDKEEYKLDETAVATVTRGPDVASAALFVEREQIFHREVLRFDGQGQARVRLPVRRSYAREVKVRVVGVRRGKALRGEKGPILSVSETLTVSDDPFRLNVGLKTDQKAYRPGGKVTVSLQVTDGLKWPRAGEVVLMAVDEAVLNLTRYYLPDPYHRLAHTPDRDVLTEDVRRFLARLGVRIVHRDHTNPVLSGYGTGGGGLAGSGTGRGGLGVSGAAASPSSKGPEARRDFRTTAWHARMVTDKDGQATASFTLPDNVTSYRIMAFAVDKDRSAGVGSTSFRVDLPLLILPALPRLLREGDRASAGVVLYSTTAPLGPARVTARVKGDSVVLRGEATKTVRLERGVSTEVRFAFAARRKGTSVLGFTVEKDGVTDGLELPLEVQRPVLPEASSVSGETRGAVRHGLEPLSALRPDFGGLEVSLASTALAGVEDGMEQLLEYPYGCFEQVASRLMPLLARAALGDRFALKLPRKPGPLVRSGLQQLYAMQRQDGGFGYWPGATRSDPWISAYGLVVLHRAARVAKITGEAVPKMVTDRALGYLERAARDNALVGRFWFTYVVFIHYALALHGRDVTKAALELYRKRQHQPLFSRAILLATLALVKPTVEVTGARERLANELGDSLKVDGTTAHAEEGLHWDYQLFMHSDDRTSAMVLHALLLSKPDHPMLTRLVRWFLVGRKQARFRNTQEAAWALLAMWDFAEIREKEVPDFEAGLWLGGKRIIKARFAGRTTKPVLRSIPMSELMKVAGKAAKDLTVARRGTGTLYYVARLRYARRELPSKPRDHGFGVTRQVQVLDKAGRPLARQRPPALNDTVLVTLRVTNNEARRYVVVEDPLPAGLQSIDTTLATASGQDARALGGLETSRFDHRELRDDRALFFRDFAQAGTLVFRYLARVSTPGTFLAPPTRAEEMYNPEIFGHNASGQVTYPDPRGP